MQTQEITQEEPAVEAFSFDPTLVVDAASDAEVEVASGAVVEADADGTDGEESAEGEENADLEATIDAATMAKAVEIAKKAMAIMSEGMTLGSFDAPQSKALDMAGIFDAEVEATGPDIDAGKTFLVPVHLLRDRNNVRVAFNRLEQLAQSLASVGQLQSVLVVPDATEDGCWEVKSGGRRLRAARDILQWENLRCRRLNLDSLHAELAALDSNLENDSLKGADLDFALARQKEIYEILYPETVLGHNKPKDELTAKRFTQTKAEQLGVSETVVKDSIRRAEGLSDMAKAAYKAGDIDKTEATTVSSLPAAMQDTLLAKAFAAATKEEAKKILRAGLKDETKKKREERQEKRLTKLIAEAEGKDFTPVGIDLRNCRVRELVETWTGTASLVHADPAWKYDNQNLNGTTDVHYESDGMADIVVMLDKAYDKAADNAYMLLWLPLPLLKEWFDASNGDELRWQYKSGGTWGKTGRKGIGFHWRGDSELLLLYVKGRPQPLDNNVSNFYTSTRTEHSEKPEDWLVTLVGSFCQEQGTVMDLWAGLGSMARACVKQGRGYVGAEADVARHREALLLLAKQEN